MARRFLQFILILIFTFSSTSAAMGQSYIVKSGDTLWGIAKKYNLTINQIQAANKLKSQILTIGTVLTIPGNTASSAKTAVKPTQATVYTVKSGDSLWSIARQFNLTVSQIKAINNLSSETLKVGQKLKISGSTPTTAAVTNQTTIPSPSTVSKPSGTMVSSQLQYIVKQGDSLSSIAQLFGISVADLGSANISVPDKLKVGQVLTIPKSSSSQTPERTGTSNSNVQAEPSRGSSTIRDLVTEACKYFGVPYVSGGTTPEGFDCSGYVYYVFKAVGISLPRSSSEQSAVGQSIERNELTIGDLVFFSTDGSTAINHVGICLGDSTFIHCSSNHGVVISNLYDTYYKNCYTCARKVF